MILRRLQLVTPYTRYLHTTATPAVVAGSKPVLLRSRNHSISSRKGTPSMGVEEDIRFLHKYSACDVCAHLRPSFKADV